MFTIKTFVLKLTDIYLKYGTNISIWYSHKYSWHANVNEHCFNIHFEKRHTFDIETLIIWNDLILFLQMVHAKLLIDLISCKYDLLIK